MKKVENKLNVSLSRTVVEYGYIHENEYPAICVDLVQKCSQKEPTITQLCKTYSTVHYKKYKKTDFRTYY